MRSFVSKILPQRIALQIMLVVLSAMVAMVLISTAIFSLTRPQPPAPEEANAVLKAGMILERLNEAPKVQRPALLASLQADVSNLKLSLVEGEIESPASASEQPPFWRFRPGELVDGVKLVSVMPEPPANGLEPAPVLYFQFGDGSLVSVRLQPHEGPPIFGNPMFLMLMFAGISMVLLVLWVTKNLVRPLSELAVAASSFGRKSTTPVPIAESGAREVREAARAFNRMQGRIQEQVERRTRMLTAIGHDLRTPITRLRLRLDLPPDDVQKQRTIADLDLMETQLDGALTFLRDGRGGEGTTKVNLPSLLQGIGDLYEDMGAALSLDCEPGLTVEGRPTELYRAISNLIDNARRYDDRIALRAHSDDAEIMIDVIDHGPGIAPEDRARMLEPFERGDEARQLDHGGSFGLGLATALAIAEAHGGTLELLDTKDGGLTARIALPQT